MHPLRNRGSATLVAVRVERLDPDEWARLRVLRLRALEDEPDAFGGSAQTERAHDEAAWRRFATLGPWWVAVEEDRDVGLVAAGRRDDDPTVRVYSMWVARACRGRGVADALLDAVRAYAVAAGSPRIALDVADRVPRARRLYERYGFVATGVVEPMDRDPAIRLVELALDLDLADGARGADGA